MQHFSLAVLLSLVILAGCSSPTTEPKEEESPTPQAISANSPTARNEATSQGDTKQTVVPPQPAAETLAPPPQAARMKAGGTVGAGAAVRAQPQWIAPQAWNRESYNATQESGFIAVGRSPLSTFSIDVDTAAYANVRRFITGGSLPPKGAVRIEEMINFFSYDYPAPLGTDPLGLSAEIGPSPFHHGYRLARIGVTARDLAKEELPPSNLVFLVDVSGSMQDANKLPLLKQAMALLVRQLNGRDRVSLVVYAGADRVVLLPTPGNRQQEILAAIDGLQAGGSTHASSGIRTAYQLARQSFLTHGNNRVILASDGDFNVGVTSRDELQRLIETEGRSGVYLTVLGFGMGNYHDDTMEILADKGNGNYAYIDNLLEAKKVLVKELSGTLFTLANDVKIQVEFNPARVGAYRLIGYENRALANEDFRDDRKDAGEIGVGHRVTALYELIPAGNPSLPELDRLKYQTTQRIAAEGSPELLTVKLRYKPKAAARSRQISLAVNDATAAKPSADFRFAAAVAGYGMLLTHSEHLGTFSWGQCLAMARSGRGSDAEGYRAEFARLVEMSQLLAQQGQPAMDNPDEPQPMAQPMLR